MHSAAAWVAALRGSHDRLRVLVSSLEPSQLTRRAYPADWSIAQVLSHLGSGAEIFTLFVEAGVAGTAPPGRELMAPIWDAWNAKTPQQQAAAVIGADRRLVERFEELASGPGASLTMELFGRTVDLAGLVGSRLSEHALHSWDVAVALDPAQPVAAQPVALLVDTVAASAGRAGKAVGGPLSVRVTTTDPVRDFLLTVSDRVTMAAVPDGSATARVSLPAESLLRLVAGRLDPEHTPAAVTATGVDLDDLRAVFPGY